MQLEEFQNALSSLPVKEWAVIFLMGWLAQKKLPNVETSQSIRGYILNICYIILYLGIMFLIYEPIKNLLRSLVTLLGLSPLFSLKFIDATNWIGLLTISLILLITNDFFYYWWHRLQHRVPWLWDQHVVHHSDDEMNILSGARVHWTEIAFQAFAIGLPMKILVIAGSKDAFILAGVWTTWNILAHSNVRLSFGRFYWVIISPQYHRIHHSILPIHRDKNFASIFPIWDLMFGTYFHPEPDEYPPTGVENVKLTSLWQLLTYPFGCWSTRIWKNSKSISL